MTSLSLSLTVPSLNSEFQEDVDGSVQRRAQWQGQDRDVQE